MANNAQVQAMVAKLAGKKTPFLNDVEHSIYSYISGSSWQNCLTLVERRADGSKRFTWYPSEVFDGYTGRLIAFLRKKPYDGYDLDSYLTDGVVARVTKEFENFYADNANALAEPLLKQLMADKVFVNMLAKEIVEASNSPLSQAMKDKLAEHLAHVLEDSMQVNISQIALDGIQTIITKVVAGAAALPISNAVLAVLLKNVAFFLKGAIAKVMATTAFKTMFAAAVKKLVAVKIIAVLAAILAPVIGSVSIVYIVAPLIAAFIAYEVATLPENMGEKVSVAVRQELSGEFDKISTNVVTEILKSLTKDTLCALAKNIAGDANFKDIVSKLDKN